MGLNDTGREAGRKALRWTLGIQDVKMRE